MKRILMLAAVLCLVLPRAEALSAATKIAPELRAKIAALPQGGMISVIVMLESQANLGGDYGRRPVASQGRPALGPSPDRAARLQGVVRGLQATAATGQASVRAYVASQVARGLARDVTYFWIFDGLALTAAPDVIAALAARPDVRRITPDAIDVVPVDAADTAPEPNLAVVNAPALWALGLLGQGIVVASMDSGVDVTHPELAGRWRGGANSWFDPYGQHPVAPIDLLGHGTWTMGVMVGGDAAGTAIGMAPQAQWIAARIFNDTGSATATAIHLGYQWLLDPDGDPDTPDAPNVVNNSWGFAYPGCNLEFEPDLLALRAAGILPVFAAGNSGPAADSGVSPANNPSAFAVGATDNADAIYVLSSRGPSSCGGSGSVFPDVVAPGVDIRTTGLFGTYGDYSGTSLATPHVSGGLALLLSAYPALSAEGQARLLREGAVDLGLAGPDDVFGYGRLDLLATYGTAGQLADLTIDVSGTSEQVTTGTPLTYTLTITNVGPLAATAVTVTDLLPVGVLYGGVSGAGWMCGRATDLVTCTLATLDVGTAPGIALVITPVVSGTLTTTVSVSALTPDLSPANNTRILQTSVVSPTPPLADLAITLAAAPDPVSAGETLTYTVTVTNAGPDTATHVVASTYVPDDTVLLGASGDGWTCAGHDDPVSCGRPDLGVEEASTLSVTVATALHDGMVVADATVSAAEEDPHLEDNAATVTTRVDPIVCRIYLPLVVRSERAQGP